MSKFLIFGAAGLIFLVGGILLAEGTDPSSTSENRFLAHLSTDKPIYRVGERVFLRAVVLGATQHTPLDAEHRGYALLTIAGPKGEKIANDYTAIRDSVAAFMWAVPEETSGGQYTATVSFPQDGFPPAVRKFEIRAYRTPRLKGEIIFLRDGFGPGDTVRASLHVERAEGGTPAGAQVTANAVVDGAGAFTGETTVDAAGNCSVEFPLPAKIERGDGTLSLSVADGGVVEPIAKTIPILLNTVDLAIYPEGGDLIAGLPCRVYVEAKTPSKKPADLVGQVIDSHGHSAVDFTTEHEGRGRFTFTPKSGETYSIKLSQPAGIAKIFPLPEVKTGGVVLTSDSDVTEGSDAVRLAISATDAGTYSVSLSKRQVEVSSTLMNLGKGETKPVVLTPPAWADGVLVATVKSAGNPMAERLIFRKPAHPVHVKVTTSRDAYIPGDAVAVNVATTDDQGRPVSAVVGLTATDESVLRMMEKRDRAPRLNEMVLLEDDVQDLADAEIYFDPTDPKSALATDLLLGTQGWRRFATVEDQKFIDTFGDQARRALGLMLPPEPITRTAIFGARGGGFGGGGGDVGAAPLGAAARLNVQKEAAQAEAAKEPEDQMLLDDRTRMQGEDKIQPAQPPDENGIIFDQPADRPAFGRAGGGQGGGGGGGGGGFGGGGRAAANMRLVPATRVIRIYAHNIRPDRAPNDRVDFAETLYWAAGIKTDDRTGMANFRFDLNDSVTSFDITADAFDASGNLGEGKTTITSSEPFYVEPKLPLEVTSGDVIRLPVAAVNGTQASLDGVKLNFTAGKGITVGSVDPFNLAGNERARRLVDVKIGNDPGTSKFIVQATAGNYSDKVERDLVVKPLGFPTEITNGGKLLANGKVVHEITVPDSLVSGSMTTQAALYPTPLANLTQALERLLQEPCGCFEQTSSTTYPLVMADQYFMSHEDVDPALISRSNTLLDEGYARLTGFECKNKGYEWFGEDPGHECLTAYGLLEFSDMSTVRNVDQAMLANTRAWLLARRVGDGTFTHERRSLHTWITDPDCANGYCTWALLETGQKGLDQEVQWLGEHARADSNSYVKALAANALFLAGDHAGAKKFMDELASLQDADGHVRGASTTVVGSGGESLEIETTSLATLAWLRDSSYARNVDLALKFLADSCQSGRYGSTQSTVLALRAIVAYDKARAHPTASGKVQVVVDDKSVGDALAFDATTTGAILLPDFSSHLNPGKHEVELRMTDGSDLPYSLSVSFNSLTPASSDECKLMMTTKLSNEKLDEGMATEATVTVTNRAGDTLPTPIAIVGIPGGLEVRHDQLKELVKAGRIAAYEVRGREVVLYWREIQPKESIEISLSLLAAIPGDYTAPSSRVYLYYTDEFKQWLPGLHVSVKAKE